LAEKMRILVVDDEPDVRRALSRLLSRGGYQVLEASTGEEGLRLAREERPDLILLDVMLADMGGLEICERIKADAELARSLVLLFSGNQVDSESRAQGLESGADGYIRRGLPPRELLARVEAMLRIKRAEESHRQALHALRESEARYRSIAEDIPALVCRFRPDGVLTFVNSAYARYFGECRQELEGQSFFQFIPKGEREAVRQHYRALTPENPATTYEHQVLAPDGTERWQRWTDRAHFDAHGRAVEYQSLGQDITEEKRAEEALRYQAQLAASVSDAVISTDLDFNVRTWNKAAETIYGWRADEVIGKPIAEVTDIQYPHDEASAVLEQFRAAGYWRGEVLQRRKDGTLVHVLASVSLLRDNAGEPAGAVAVNHDITERVRAEAALKRSEATARVLLNAPTDAVALIDVDGTILRANATLARRLGRPLDELAGLCIWDLYPHRARERSKTKVDQVVRSREPVRFEDERDGRWNDNVVYPVCDARGEVTSVALLARDITERKQMEQALRERTVELGERVKELNCLYSISALVERRGVSLEEILRGTVELIPPAWQYPEVACARITLDGRAYQTENFRQTRWRQVSTIFAHGEPKGTLEVCYLEERPPVDARVEGNPFQEEEKKLLDVIAERLGRISERIRAEGQLRRRIAELSVLNQIAYTLATTTDLTESLRTITQTTAELFDAQIAVLGVRDGDGTTLQVRAAFERTSGARASTPLAIPLESMPSIQRALEQGASIVVPDVQRVPLDPPFRALVAERDLHAVLVMPLQARGESIGVLILGTNQDGVSYEPDEIALAETIAGDVAAAIENARLSEQAQAAAAAAERERLARELHDAVTQKLFSVNTIAEALPRVWERAPEEAERGLAELRGLAQAALAEMRTLLLELRPASLAKQNLDVLLQQLAEVVMARTRIPVDTTITACGSLPEAVQLAFYRVAQEALNNVDKHSRASQAELSLQCDPDRARLRIRDDGRGFDPRAVQTERLGLEIMQERAQAIGATLKIASQQGQGTEITLVWSGATAETAETDRGTR
jgi:PAS domain S-box-containing protein